MEIVLDRPDVVMGWHAPVVVVWWRNTPNLAAAQAVHENLTRVMQNYGVGCIFVVLTDTASVGAPDRASADVLGKTTRSLEKYIVAHAFVIEGTGLRSSALRQTVRMLQSFTRVIFPQTIAQTTEEGFLWVARKAQFLTEEEARVILGEVKQMKAARGA
ncbi:MAG: hypothetical protein IPM54_42060 [Polyangiaceae bacterium]|nr:hypothetical protein [Polyangiaceae bacterium]